MRLNRFSNFLNENFNDFIYLGVLNIDSALVLSSLLKRWGYKYADQFDDDLIADYFDLYVIDDDKNIFAFVINTNKKEIAYRVITKDNFFILSNKDKAFLYPLDIQKINKKLITNPIYTPKEFVYEQNEVYPYPYIVVKINNIDELNVLRNMLRETFGYTTHISTRYDFPNYLFIRSDLKNNLDYTSPWLNPSTPSQSMIDSFITNADDTDGTYRTIDELHDIKQLLKGESPKPTYKPKKFVYEDNKLKKINSFNDFMILEDVDDAVPFIISQRLEDLLKKIKHPIAKELINMSADDDGYTDEATLIDLSDIEDDQFIYTSANKYKDTIVRHNKNISPELDKSKIYDFIKTNTDIYRSYPSSIRIGRLINKLFPGKYPVSGLNNSIESFVDSVITKRREKFKNIDIVNGEDIIKYYNENNYIDDAFNGSELGNSCMRYDSCTDYIQFYADNPDVRLVILRSGKDKNKISARALLWKIEYKIGEEKSHGYFLDRVYFTKRYQKNLLTQYAKKKGWFYKRQQNSLSDAEIFDPTMNFSHKMDLKTVPTFKKSSTGEYPYLDTLKWFYVDRGFLSNTLKFKEGDETVYALEDTDGRYTTEENGVYISYYDDYINEDDLVYCEYGDDMRLMDDAIYLPDEDAFATEEYAKNNCFFDDSGYCILKNKAVKYIDSRGKTKYTSKKHALDNYYYSTIDNTFHELAHTSDEYETYLPYNKSIKVYLDSKIDKILKDKNENYDYYLIGDGKYFKYQLKDSNKKKPIAFSNKVKDDFVLVKKNLNSNDKEYYHKVYDRDKFEKRNGEYVVKR